MRKIMILLLFVVFTAENSIAQKINWISLEKAVALQKKEPKKIMMDAYTSWCGPCKMLDRNTFSNSDVANYINQYYYAVKFNAEGNDEITFNDKTYTNPNYDPAKANKRNSSHQLAGYFGVRSYPTIIFLSEEGELIFPLIGYKTPQQLELYLKMFKNDEHLDLKTQEAFNEYYTAFKPEFQQ
ncbi:MAG: thioredoxin fold domain-containing protein [Bacteroidetes bacterium]|nr:thioredoxin fold domain-containing protein [Bacteroidota bacterium]